MLFRGRGGRERPAHSRRSPGSSSHLTRAPQLLAQAIAEVVANGGEHPAGGIGRARDQRPPPRLRGTITLRTQRSSSAYQSAKPVHGQPQSARVHRRARALERPWLRSNLVVRPLAASLPERALHGDRVEPPDFGNAEAAPDDHRVVGRVAHLDLEGQVRGRLGVEVDVLWSLHDLGVLAEVEGLVALDSSLLLRLPIGRGTGNLAIHLEDPWPGQ